MIAEGGSHKPDYLYDEISLVYRWAAGDTAGKFLQALQRSGKILGAVCGVCGAVAVPPLSYCEACGGDAEELREVGPRGVVISWARAGEAPQNSPVEAPFRYVLVRLEGADTALVHIAPDDDRVDIGGTVVPEFRAKREGGVTDIKWFVPEG